MASGSSQPLDLPEILNITFAFLDGKSLVACAQVNSLWADGATNVLWMNPPIFALTALLPSSRAQVYAKKIFRLQSLPFTRSHDSEFYRAYSHLSFPRLAELSLTIEDIECFPQVLQPSLRKLTLDGTSAEATQDDSAANRIFMQLSTRCPHLREVTIGKVNFTPDGLLRFLEAMPSIRDIRLWSYKAVTENVMQHLATRPNLERLLILHAVLESHATKINRASAFPFADLQYLSCSAKEDVIISKHMTKLVKLELILQKPSSLMLPALSGCPALKWLLVSAYRFDSEIVGADLVSFAERCPKLERVCLLGNGYEERGKKINRCFGNIDGSSILDSDIYRFTSLLPGLKQLRLDIHGALSVRSLHHLGRNCQGLLSCQLSGCNFDISEFGDDEITKFPMGEVAALRALDASRATHKVPSHTENRTDTNKIERTLANNMSSNQYKLLEDVETTHHSPFRESTPLFPNLHGLEVRELSNSKGSTVLELLYLLKREAPKLERFHVQSKAKFGQEVALAFPHIRRG